MKVLSKISVLSNYSCTLFVLIGISMLMFSCAPSVEKKVKQYECEGKTIIASTLGQETEHNCIVFSDNSGVYFDDMKEVSQVLAFGKAYVSVFPSLSIPCDNSGLRIDLNNGHEYTFTAENIGYYDIYPIDDWATVLCGRNSWGSDIPNFILKKGSDTIYMVDNFEYWYSKYPLQYPENVEVIEAEGEDEDGTIVAGTFSYEGTNKNQVGANGDKEGYICVKLIGGGEGALQEGCDNMSRYVQNPEYDFVEWVDENDNCTAFSGDVIITPGHFFEATSISSISFINLKNCQFSYNEIGTSEMYRKLVLSIVSKFEEEKQQRQREKINEILDQCVDIEEISHDLRNEVAAERKYNGKKVLLDLKILSINRVDSRYTYNPYLLDAQYIKVTSDKTTWIEVSCYTEDESFVELSYPHNCVIMGELMVNLSSPGNLLFENCELVIY